MAGRHDKRVLLYRSAITPSAGIRHLCRYYRCVYHLMDAAGRLRCRAPSSFYDGCSRPSIELQLNGKRSRASQGRTSSALHPVACGCVKGPSGPFKLRCQPRESCVASCSQPAGCDHKSWPTAGPRFMKGVSRAYQSGSWGLPQGRSINTSKNSGDGRLWTST